MELDVRSQGHVPTIPVGVVLRPDFFRNVFARRVPSLDLYKWIALVELLDQTRLSAEVPLVHQISFPSLLAASITLGGGAAWAAPKKRVAHNAMTPKRFIISSLTHHCMGYLRRDTRAFRFLQGPCPGITQAQTRDQVPCGGRVRQTSALAARDARSPMKMSLQRFKSPAANPIACLSVNAPL